MRVLICVLMVAMVGCTQDYSPIERVSMSAFEKVVVPVVEKAVRETATQTATLQGGVQGINPTYVVEFEGKWVVGLEGTVRVGVEGVAGQLTGHSQTSATAPAKTEDE